MSQATIPTPKLSVRLFGAPHVTYAQETLTIPRNQVRALFYRLASQRDWIARQHLCFLFWPDVADTSARQSLTLALSHLRRALPVGELLVADNVNARLAEQLFDADVVEFEALCTGEHRRIERLKEAVTLYRGPFLDGITLDNCPEFENWQLAERSRYERLFLDALSTLIADAVARGAYDEAIGYAQRYLQTDPLEEEIHRRLIELYVAAGDRSAAMQQYEQCALLLERELGVSPMPETFAIFEAAQHERPNNLPLPPTALIGRKDELTQTTALLRRDDVWLVTLNGPGGSGKTRLALEVAVQLLPHFLHGAYFVDLSPIRNPQLVIGTIARALGLLDAGIQPMKETLCNFLSERHLLLVLDNFEQVLDAAPHLSDLHAAAPGLKILVTSRAALHLRGEREMPVPPLPLARLMEEASPQDFLHSDAVRLFVERAQDVRPGFELNESNADAVATVCARVDGLPLAIELAAARCKLLTPQAILDRLTAPLDLLARGARDLPDRQQTLRATITWSANLLNADERALFRRLGVFRGGFTVDTAAAVCNAADDLDIDVLDGLAALLDHNLIRYASDHNDDEPRFTMLETIRSFAWDELGLRGELDTAQRTHAGFFLQLAEEARPQLRGHKQSDWLHRLTQEYENLTSAIEWMLENSQSAFAMRLGYGLGYFWSLTTYLSEGVILLARVLSLPGADIDPILWSRVLYTASLLQLLTGKAIDALVFANKALDFAQSAGNTQDSVQATLQVGHCLTRLVQMPAARIAYRKAEMLAQQLHDPILQADVLLGLANTMVDTDRRDEDINYREKALDIFLSYGDIAAAAATYSSLGNQAALRGMYIEAENYCVRALSLYHKANSVNYRVADTLGRLAWIKRVQFDYVKSIEHARECIRFRSRFGIEEPGDYVILANSLQSMGLHSQAIGAYEKATTLSRKYSDTYMLAQALADYGDALLYSGEMEQAKLKFREALLIHQDFIEDGNTMYLDVGATVALVSELATARHDYKRATRLIGAAESHVANIMGAAISIPIADFPDYERAKVFVREQMDAGTFDKLYTEGASMNLSEVVRYALSGLE